jgi:excisionase family DNA binding protein
MTQVCTAAPSGGNPAHKEHDWLLASMSCGQARPPRGRHYRGDVAGRFLTREQVADELAISKAQVYALLRRKDLRAMKIGGRGIWRISREDLETYIERTYKETARWIDTHPFTEDEEVDPDRP